MALAAAVTGGKRPSQTITWTDADGTALDLTGATLSGRIRDESTKTARAIDGTLTITDATNGVFRWDYGTTDVGTAGLFTVQFVATYGSGVTPAKTITSQWVVHEAI